MSSCDMKNNERGPVEFEDVMGIRDRNRSIHLLFRSSPLLFSSSQEFESSSSFVPIPRPSSSSNIQLCLFVFLYPQCPLMLSSVMEPNRPIGRVEPLPEPSFHPPPSLSLFYSIIRSSSSHIHTHTQSLSSHSSTIVSLL